MKTLNSLFTRERLVLLFILLFFGLIFSSISLVNHYFFRSNAFDMGWYNKTIFDYSRLRFCDFTLGIRHVKCVLGDHFELYPLLFAPLRLLFGSWTLLIIQLLSVLFGSYGIYIYFRFRTERKWLPFLAMLFFLSTWGVYAALSFDYHNNLVGAMLIPWFFHFFEKGNTPNRREHLNTWFFFVLILVSKEPMAFFMAFVSLGLCLIHWSDLPRRKLAGVFCLVALVYFVMMIKVIMPSIAPDEIGYKHFNYHILGEDMVDVIKHIIKAPGYALGLLYTNHTQRPNLAIQKWDTLLILFFAGGYMLIWRPKFLLMVFPVLCMKMWSDDPQKWTPALHYSVEFIPILCLAVFGYWIKIKKDRFALLFSLVSLIFAIGTTVYFFEFRFKLFWRPEEEQFYRAIHYERNIDLEAAYEGLESLPADAMVSAQGQFVPHVAMRRYITLFPFVRDANYIVLNPGLSTYPHAREFYEGKLKKYRAIWETIYEKGGTLVLRRPPGWIDPDQ